MSENVIGRALFPNLISDIPQKWACNVNAKFIDGGLENIFTKSSLPKYDLQNWHWYCKTQFLDWALPHFGKEPSIFTSTCLYI